MQDTVQIAPATETREGLRRLATFLSDHGVQLVTTDAAERASYSFGELNGQHILAVSPAADYANVLAEVRPVVERWKTEEQAKRSISYQLRGGGLLVAECPDWCVLDHEGDLDGRLVPEELAHAGAPVVLEFATVEGTTARLLDARITQYPFAGDGTERPYMALMPDANSGESTGWLSAGEFDAEIRRVEEHLIKLRSLGVQLAEARADDHAKYTDHEWFRDGQGQPWLSIENDDIETMPISYLIKVFGITVVEVDADSRPADKLAVLSGEAGSMTLSFKRCVTQVMREQLTRAELLKSRGGRRG